MSLKTIRESFHAQFLQIRNMHRLIWSDDFSIVYNSASKEKQKEIKSAIERNDKLSLRKLIKEQLNKMTPFHKMGIRALREIGKNLRLPNYWRKDKGTLIEEIEHVIQRLKEDCK